MMHCSLSKKTYRDAYYKDSESYQLERSARLPLSSPILFILSSFHLASSSPSSSSRLLLIIEPCLWHPRVLRLSIVRRTSAPPAIRNSGFSVSILASALPSWPLTILGLPSRLQMRIHLCGMWAAGVVHSGHLKELGLLLLRRWRWRRLSIALALNTRTPSWWCLVRCVRSTLRCRGVSIVPVIIANGYEAWRTAGRVVCLMVSSFLSVLLTTWQIVRFGIPIISSRGLACLALWSN